MYIVADMIDIGLDDGQKWASPVHWVVAQNAFLCNPNIRDAGTLMINCGIVNKIPVAKIKKVTFKQLRKLGCSV